MLAVGESVNLFFSHVRESSFITRSVIEIMMLMLWEGGWEWTRLIKSIKIFQMRSGPPPPPPFLLLIYIYSSSPLLGVRSYAISSGAPPLAPPPPENLHSVRSCPKKVEKTSSENTTFAKSEHPYRTCGSLGGIFFFFHFPIFDQKPIIPFEAVPKKSKKRKAET